MPKLPEAINASGNQQQDNVYITALNDEGKDMDQNNNQPDLD